MSDKLNDVYKEMLDEISKIFPFSKNVIDEYDKDLDFYKMFIKNNILHLEDISVGNAVNLCNNNFYITDGIKFKEIWDDKLCNIDIKNTIWKYLHSMIFIICDNELQKYTESQFKDHKKFEDMCEIIKKKDKILDNLKNFKENKDTHATGLEGTAIGSLAKEIMDDIGMSGDIDPSKPPSIGDLGSLMSKTFSAIQSKMSSGDFNESKMMAEASQMMGGMNLFGQDNSKTNSNIPRGMSGMPMNKMNVNKRKIIRKKKKNNNKK